MVTVNFNQYFQYYVSYVENFFRNTRNKYWVRHFRENDISFISIIYFSVKKIQEDSEITFIAWQRWFYPAFHKNRLS